MHALSLNLAENAPATVLCLGAHCDDIEIGAGATLMRLADEYPGAMFHWVVFSGNDVREAETRACAERLIDSSRLELSVQRFRNGYFPFAGDKIKDHFETLKTALDPDVVFTHYRDDRHQDHRAVSDLTWNTFRDHQILEYEIPKFDGDIGQPNLFFPVSHVQRRAKLDALIECFASQSARQWFDRSTFDALMRLRGVESNAPSGYAEAFYARKCVV